MGIFQVPSPAESCSLTPCVADMFLYFIFLRAHRVFCLVEIMKLFTCCRCLVSSYMFFLFYIVEFHHTLKNSSNQKCNAIQIKNVGASILLAFVKPGTTETLGKYFL